MYPNGDLASAFFDVSVNKALTAEQCGEFSEARPVAPADTHSSGYGAVVETDDRRHGTAVLGNPCQQGTREEASKYYHVFENGACYEFALKVATTGVGAKAESMWTQGSLPEAGEDSGYGEDQSGGARK